MNWKIYRIACGKTVTRFFASVDDARKFRDERVAARDERWLGGIMRSTAGDELVIA